MLWRYINSSGTNLAVASAKRQKHCEGKVLGILSDRMESQRLNPIEQAMRRPQDLAAVLPQMLPADSFYLGVEFQKRFPCRSRLQLARPGSNSRTLCTATQPK